MIKINDVIIGFIFFIIVFIFYLKKWGIMGHSFIQNMDIKLFILILLVITNIYIFYISKLINRLLEKI
jgi:hypothetical protein